MKTTVKTVPDFRSNWTWEMMAHFRSENWSDADISEHLIAICESWGCKEKASNVIFVLHEVMKSSEAFEEAEKRVREWAA